MYTIKVKYEWRAVTYDSSISFNFNQQSGSSYPLSLLKRESACMDCMQIKELPSSPAHGVASVLQNLSTTPVDEVHGPLTRSHHRSPRAARQTQA